jgi:hypothetical protein
VKAKNGVIILVQEPLIEREFRHLGCASLEPEIYFFLFVRLNLATRRGGSGLALRVRIDLKMGWRMHSKWRARERARERERERTETISVAVKTWPQTRPTTHCSEPEVAEKFSHNAVLAAWNAILHVPQHSHEPARATNVYG